MNFTYFLFIDRVVTESTLPILNNLSLRNPIFSHDVRKYIFAVKTVNNSNRLAVNGWNRLTVNNWNRLPNNSIKCTILAP